MHRLTLLTLFGLSTILAACSQQKSPAGAASPPTTVATQPVVIGMLAPITGVMAVHGESMQMGVRVAEKVLNDQGGILGRPVRVVVLDTQSDPATAAQRAGELIEKNKVVLLLGTGLSSETLAVIPISTRAHVPFIYSMDGEDKTCVAGDADKVAEDVWGAGFTERMIVGPFLQYLGAHVLRNGLHSSIYFLGGDYVYPRVTNQFARATAEKMGFSTAGEEYVDIGTADYSPVIRRIMRSKADLLLVTNPGSAAATFMRQAKQLGLDRSLAISGFATFAQEAVGEMGSASEGVIYANRYTDLLQSPVNEAFVATFRAMYPGKPLLPGPTVAAGAYGAMLVAAKAFAAAHSTGSEAFGKAMAGLSLELPQGTVEVDPANHVFHQHMYLLQVKDQKYHVLADLGSQSHPDFEGCSVH